MAEPGVKNFLAMQQEVAEAVLMISAATASTFPTLANVKSRLNDEMRKFVSARDWIWSVDTDTTKTLATSTTDYTMITGLREIILLRNQTTKKVYNFMRRDLFEREYKGATSTFATGEPTYWTYIQRASDNSVQIRFNASPPAANNGDTLDITYYKRHTDLSDNTDTAFIPVEFQDVPIYRTIAHFKTLLNDHQDAAIWQAKAEDLELDAFVQHSNQPGHVDTPNDAFANGVTWPWPYNE